MASDDDQVWYYQRLHFRDSSDALGSVAGILFHVARRALTADFFSNSSCLENAVEIELDFYGARRPWRGVLTYLPTGAHDIDWHIDGFYYCLRRGDGASLCSTAYPAALPHTLRAAVSHLRNPRVLFDDVFA